MTTELNNAVEDFFDHRSRQRNSNYNLKLKREVKAQRKQIENGELDEEVLMCISGERIIKAGLDVLTKEPKSKLAKLIHGHQSNEIFIKDRDPNLFILMVEFLRTDFKLPPKKYDDVRVSFKEELEFWGLMNQYNKAMEKEAKVRRL